jgi:hypothetical protein
VRHRREAAERPSRQALPVIRCVRCTLAHYRFCAFLQPPKLYGTTKLDCRPLPKPRSGRDGSRPHLGALLLDYCAYYRELSRAGPVGSGMPVKVLADRRRRLEPLTRKTSLLDAAQHARRIATRAFSRVLGRAEACR